MIKAQTIERIEYFYDMDPGVGNAMSFGSFPVTDSLFFSSPVATTGLTGGIHTLYIRTKDSDGRWSLAEPRTITVLPVILAAEYFYDVDPGLGNAISFGPFTNKDSVNFSMLIPTSGLISGIHTLYIRTKDSDGKWSLSEPRTITVLPTIVAAEYFFDIDPGIGNAIPVSSFSITDSVNFNTLIPTTELTGGNHLLYIRTKDSDGKWSLAEPRTFTVLPVITAAEYFYDTDPGKGNAIVIPTVSTGADSINFNYLFPTHQLTSGQHELYVRIKDSDNKWSLAEPRTFTIRNDTSLLVKIFIEGFYTGNYHMQAVADPVYQPLICDPLIIGLAYSDSPYAVFYEQPTYLMTDGTAVINLPSNALGQSYYIYVKARNSIEVWSKIPVLIATHTNYDFTLGE